MDRRSLGSLLIIAGVAVWPIGLFVLPLFGIVLPVRRILLAHLVLVIPGALLRGSRILALIRGK